MPRFRRHKKLKSEELAWLRESLVGENGYGLPKLPVGYELTGDHNSRLRPLYDIVTGQAWTEPHQMVQSEFDMFFEGIDSTTMRTAYWGDMIKRLSAMIDSEVKWSYFNHWTPKPRVQVVIYRTTEGEYFHFVIPDRVDSLSLLLRTNSVLLKSINERAERRARRKLLTELNKEQRKQITITGSFVEIGRSGVHYLIRPSRPTIATRETPYKDGLRNSRFLGALCLHPLGYYMDTYAGCMPPSDEMLTHLKMIRTDEHYFWRKANQHGMSEPRAGM